MRGGSGNRDGGINLPPNVCYTVQMIDRCKKCGEEKKDQNINLCRLCFRAGLKEHGLWEEKYLVEKTVDKISKKPL